MKNTIRIERTLRKMTQEELAKQVGVSRQTINSIESGRYIPSTIIALKIARCLQKKTEKLFWLEEFD
jgi:putative transcriptional regulator